MDDQLVEAIALHRWAIIAEAVNPKLSSAERGVVVRSIAARTHAHPDGSERCYARNTIDRWVRAWRAGGLEALRPKPRSDSGLVRYRPELLEEAAALRLELPTRSAAAISDMLCQQHGVRVPERTVASYLRRRGLHREALTAEPKVFGRYEASEPNERWITDVLVGPWVPHPKVVASVRARLFLIVDDHSRLLVHGRFHGLENARAGQEVLRAALVRRGLPAVLYCDNGPPFSNRALDRSCAILGIRLVHSKPYSPEGRGKQERLNRYIRERFIAEAEHTGIERPVRGMGRTGGQPTDPRRDRPEPRPAVGGWWADPGGRPRPPGRSVPMVDHSPGDPHCERLPGGQRVLGGSRPGRPAG